MGIESDQLVYDYLSRVGDLAQQRQLPASDRMRLVSTLRNEIDRRRATYGEESPAAVRGILGALGTPDEVVERAEDGPGAASGAAGAAGPPLPKPRTRAPGTTKTTNTTRSAKATKPAKPTKPAKATDAARTAQPAQPAQPAKAPGKAGKTPAKPPARQSPPSSSVPPPRDGDMDPDWWRTDATRATEVDVTEGLPGFVGGIERPDLFFEPQAPEADTEESGDEEAGPGRWRRAARVVLRRKAAPAHDLDAGLEEETGETAEAPARPRLANPFVLLAALLLIGGAVFGSLLALAVGWLLAYASRRLTPGEVKGAVLVIPGLAAASGIVWLWGRVEGRWGEAVAPGGEAMGAAVSETWPWVLRGAAVASALFLLWRSRKH
ncbi:hypothetical protein [Streptomyces narbonensis]|uniref:hypothetical protein n=1 Tax=Streptomyces narbonensis TaxID=67333 RepID=UPI0016794A6D|nr:hypothetical protein [Streptomyces narbonensis]GGV97647.1 hypothetical protein GCM10010230_18850 [Streptomyces narbonensis]